MKIIIFDIDGTLANLDHRLHYIKNGKRDWQAFHDNVHLDIPIKPMVELCHTLYNARYSIILVTGRMESNREATKNWCIDHEIWYDELYMRPTNDYRPDTVVKKEILDQIKNKFNREILFAVDDRSSVVKMWRDAGIICLQCNEWEE